MAKLYPMTPLALLAVVVPLLPPPLNGPTLRAEGKEPAKQKKELEELLRLDPGGCVGFVALSPDGKTLAYGLSPFGIEGPESKVAGATVLINVADGKERLRILSEKGEWPSEALFSPDGKLLAIGKPGGAISLWDPATGKLVRPLLGASSMGNNFCFSPDGKQFAATLPGGGGVEPYTQDIVLWDVATGKDLKRFGSKPHGPVTRFSFSEDGKTIAAEHYFFVSNEGGIGGRGAKIRFETSAHLWEAATGKDLGQVGSVTETAGVGLTLRRPHSEGKFEEIGAAGEDASASVRSGTESTAYPHAGYRFRRYTKDTILLMPVRRSNPYWVAGESNGTITLHRFTSGSTVAQWTNFQRGNLRNVSLTPDGKYLAACGELPRRGGSTLFLWDLSTLPKTTLSDDVKTTPTAVKTWWTQMTSVSSPPAHKAMRLFVAFPDKALPLLEDKLLSVPAPDEIPELIAQLDDDDESTRTKAARLLELAGNDIRPALEKALRGDPSVRKKRALTDILAAKAKGPTGEELRGMRAIDVLEQIGTAKARAILTKLQAGATAAPLTQAAKAALVRMKQAPSSPEP